MSTVYRITMRIGIFSWYTRRMTHHIHKHKIPIKILITAIALLIVGTSAWQLRSADSRERFGFGFERFSNRITYFIGNQIAFVSDPFADSVKLSVKHFKQEHALTCEVASLRSALEAIGTTVSEDELLDKLEFDTRGPISADGVWGDPEKGFVGDINGSVFKRTGYGVYEQPIARLAEQYSNAAVMEEPSLESIIMEINAGNPVIAWGLLSDRVAVKWRTIEGKEIAALPGEHARVVMGYYGDATSPTKIILMDPIYGKITLSTEKFLSEWKKMGNRAVVVF